MKRAFAGLAVLLVAAVVTATWYWASVTAEEVEFDSGELTLRGTMLTPRGSGSKAGVVLVHGSGEVTRKSMMAYAWLFALKGLAVVAYDKRGVGASEGGDTEWREFNFENLASDAAAALEFLRAQPEVDGARVGYFAASQGAWVTALAATHPDRPAFIIMASASFSTVAEDRLFGREAQLRYAGFDEHSVAEARELLRQDHQVTRSGLDHARYVQLWREYSKRPWFAEVYGSGEPEPKGSARRHWERTVLDFDPQPLLSSVEVPVLWVFGDPQLDRFSPVALSVSRVEQERARGRCYRLIQIDGVGHTLEPETKNVFDFLRVRASLLMDVYRWLDDVGAGTACTQTLPR